MEWVTNKENNYISTWCLLGRQYILLCDWLHEKNIQIGTSCKFIFLLFSIELILIESDFLMALAQINNRKPLILKTNGIYKWLLCLVVWGKTTLRTCLFFVFYAKDKFNLTWPYTEHTRFWLQIIASCLKWDNCVVIKLKIKLDDMIWEYFYHILFGWA